MNYEKLKGYIWYNGKFVKSNKAKLHVLSHSLHFASAVFEGIRIYNGKPFKLNEHIQRLVRSCEILDIKIPYEKIKIKNACTKLILKQKISDGYIRPVVWRGGQSMAPGIKNAKINLAIAAWVWPIYYSKEAKAKGISLTVSKWRRPPSICAPTHSKCSGLYMICTLAKHDAEKRKFDDALMLDIKNNICETTSSNIFFIIKNKVYTPKPDNFLNGITRQNVIKLCRKNKIKVIEKKIKFRDHRIADACFISGTAAEVTPVKKINDKFYNTKHYLIKEIMEKFEKITLN
ncbi:MAG: branched-chain amino acid transaminase [Pseudomonadota bacterium]|nr:branched-chain amino acid transaminase [Pseudomonadota bacterium]